MKPWNGKPHPPIEGTFLAGSVNVQVTNSSLGTAAVTFPAGLFTQPPIVQLNACFGSYNAMTTGVPTTSGFTAVARHYNPTNSETRTITVQWTAIQT